MYTDFFGFKEPPFAITPDPRYLYMSQRHREALAHLVYGMKDSGGFVQLTGEVGTGKTTVVRALLEQAATNINVAVILNPRLTILEFLGTICDELKIEAPQAESPKPLIDALNHWLLEAHGRGERTVLIIDEAQLLSVGLLEQVRLLTNLETTKNKLLQVILVGQPELKDLLERQDLRQVAQRITARYHLMPLNLREAGDYIRHRLQVAGRRDDLFNQSAVRQIFKLSRGIPRIINILSDRALLGAYSREKQKVDKATVQRAAEEVLGQGAKQGAGMAMPMAAAALLIAVTVAAWMIKPWELIDGGKPAVAALSPPEPVTPVVVETVDELEPDIEIPASIEPPEAEPPVVETTLSQWLAEHRDRTGTREAFEGLLSQWNVTVPALANADCTLAAERGLSCLYRKGGWPDLRGINRPALLDIEDDQGERHQVVLVGLEGNQAVLDIDGERQAWPLGDIAIFWPGEYITLWRHPVEGAGILRQGSRGEAVIWLRQALATIEGTLLSDPPNELFDANLNAAVVRFQAANGLDQDGIVGAQTFIRLQDAAQTRGEPRLQETG